MSEISYFQYYSKSENHATNNTLLALRYFYQESPQKLEEILNLLLEDKNDDDKEISKEISIGLDFKQQIPLPESTPDGLISQKPLNIYFEVKGSGVELDIGQIKRHIKSIKPKEGIESSTKILFALTSNKVPQTTVNELSNLAGKGITFAAITFTDILKALQKNCAQHETKLHDILNDYKQFLISKNLLEQAGELMTIFPVIYSIDPNVDFKVCCERAKYKAKISSKFFGLYTKKCISHIGGCVTTVVRGKFEGDEYNVEEIEFSRAGNTELTTDERRRIVDFSDIISQPRGKDHPVKKEPHRFYLFDELKETNFIKETKQGVRIPTTVYLSQWLNYDENKKEYDTDEVANKFRSITW